MMLLYRVLLWITMALSLLCAIAGLSGLGYGKSEYAERAALAATIWIGFWYFCYRQIKRIEKERDIILSDLAQLDYDRAVAKARESSIPLNRGLVVGKVKWAGNDWHAFEKDSMQYVIRKSSDSTRPIVQRI
jgi:hypothetical protein